MSCKFSIGDKFDEKTSMTEDEFKKHLLEKYADKETNLLKEFIKDKSISLTNLKPNTNAINEGKIEASDNSEHQNGNESGEETITGNSDSNGEGGKEPQEGGIGVTNAFTEKYRQEKGFEPILKKARQTNEEVWGDVMNNYDDNQARQEVELIANSDKPEISVEKQALILRDRIRLTKEYSDVNKELSEANKSKEDITTLFQKKALIEKQRQINDIANGKLGSEWGGVGNFRQELASLEYTLENQIAKAEAASKNGELPYKVRETLTKLVEQNRKLEEEYAKYKEESAQREAELRKTHEAEVIKATQKAVRQKATTKRKELADVTIDDYTKAFKKFLKIDSIDFGDGAQVYKNGIPTERIIDDLAKAVKTLTHKGIDIADAVKQVREHISKLFNIDNIKDEDIIAAHNNIQDEVRPSEDSFGGLIDALIEKNNLKKSDTILQKLLRLTVENGATKFEHVVDAIHPLIADKMNVSKEELRDAISGYGDYKRLKTGQVEDTIREIKTLAKLQAAWEAVNDKLQLPLKSGMERAKLKDDARRMRAKILAKVKELGLQPELTAKELEARYTSAIETYKKNLDNRISDIQNELETGIKRAKAVGKEPPNTPDIIAKKALLKALQKQKAEMFKGDGLTKEQRLQQSKNNIKKRISQLQTEIDSKEQAAKKEGVEPDDELKALREERDRLQAIHDDIFKPKPEPKTEGEKKIISLRSQLDKIINGEFNTPEKKVYSDEELATIKDLQAQLRAEKQKVGLIKPDKVPKTEAEKAEAKEKARLNKLQERLDEILLGNFSKENGNKPVDSKEVKSLKEQIKQAEDGLGITDYQKERVSLTAIDRAIAENERKIRENDIEFEKSDKKETPAQKIKRDQLEETRKILKQMRDDAGITESKRAEQRVSSINDSIADIEADIHTLRQGLAVTKDAKKEAVTNATIEKLLKAKKELQQIKDDLTPDEVKLQAKYDSWVRSREAQLEDLQEKEKQIKAGTYIEPPKADFTKNPLDDKGRQLTTAINKVRYNIDEYQHNIEKQNRTWVDKALNFLPDAKKFAIFAGIKIYAKLESAAILQSAVFTPIRKLAQKGLAQLPIINRIAERAPTQGFKGTSVLNNIAKTYSTWFEKESYNQALQALKTGKLDIDFIGKDHKYTKEELSSFVKYIINTHAAIKALPKQAEYWSSHRTASEWASNHGMDLQDPKVQGLIHDLAYQNATEQIFMNKNLLTENYKRKLHALETYGQGDKNTTAVGKGIRSFARVMASAMKTIYPVIGVPTNIVNEGMNLIPLVGITKAINIIGHNNWSIETLQHKDADHVMKLLGKQALGGIILGSVMMLHKYLGGQYNPKKKEDENTPSEGEIRILNTNINKVFLHHPAIAYSMAIANVYNAIDDLEASGEKVEFKDWFKNVMGSTVKMISETPLLEDNSAMVKSLTNYEGVGKVAASGLSGFIPKIIGESAQLQDYIDNNYETVKRKPQTFGERMEMNIPSLRKNVPSKAEVALDKQANKVKEDIAFDNAPESVQNKKTIKDYNADIKKYEFEIEKLNAALKNPKHPYIKDDGTAATIQTIKNYIGDYEKSIKDTKSDIMLLTKKQK